MYCFFLLYEMAAHEELKLLSVYAMFGIRTMNHQNLERAAQHKLAVSSKSRFGVFVTLRRHENVFNADDLESTRIHGCLGHWTPKYQSMTPTELIAKVQQLARDVRFNDDRRLHFETDVDQDASAVIEISFMNQPLGEIDAVNGGAFSNKTRGLIVDSGTGKRATYLPGVYPTANWSYVSQSLRQKAGLGRTAAARFYAYETTVVKFQAYSTLFSALSASHLRTDVAFFYLKHYGEFVPYEYNAATNASTINEREAVRNAACIGDVIGFAHDYRAAFENKPVLSNLEHYYQKWLKAPDAYRQASIFLIRAYNRAQVHRSRVQLMSSQLYAALNRGELEPRFELGEAISVLAQVSVPRIKALKRAMAIMRERADDMLQSESTPLDNVFELNWQSQSVYQMLKLETRTKSRPGLDVLPMTEHAIVLFRALMKTAQRTILRVDSLETNYLAVIYECLSNLDAVMGLHDARSEYSYSSAVRNEIRNQRLRFFAALADTRRGEYGLYYFKGGTQARLDITGHVISSY